MSSRDLRNQVTNARDCAKSALKSAARINNLMGKSVVGGHQDQLICRADALARHFSLHIVTAESQ